MQVKNDFFMKKDSIMNIIRENLRRILFEKGVNQSDVANAVKITHQQMSNYLTGKNNIPLYAAYEIAKYLGTDLNTLVGDKVSTSDLNNSLKGHIQQLEKELLEVYRIIKQQEDELKKLRG